VFSFGGKKREWVCSVGGMDFPSRGGCHQKSSSANEGRMRQSIKRSSVGRTLGWPWGRFLFKGGRERRGKKLLRRNAAKIERGKVLGIWGGLNEQGRCFWGGKDQRKKEKGERFPPVGVGGGGGPSGGSNLGGGIPKVKISITEKSFGGRGDPLLRREFLKRGRGKVGRTSLEEKLAGRGKRVEVSAKGGSLGNGGEGTKRR